MKKDPYFKFLSVVILSGVVLAITGLGQAPDTAVTTVEHSARIVATVQSSPAPAVAEVTTPSPTKNGHPRKHRQKKSV